MKINIAPRIRPRVRIISGFPELLPFVSVFFLMIIFFMMGSSFVPVSGIPVNLPTAKVVGTYSVKKYIVTVDREGNIYFNDLIVENLNQLKSRLLSDVAGQGGKRRNRNPGGYGYAVRDRCPDHVSCR